MSLLTYQLHWKVSDSVESTMNVNLREILKELTCPMARNYNQGGDDYYGDHQGKDTNHNQSNMPSH